MHCEDFRTIVIVAFDINITPKRVLNRAGEGGGRRRFGELIYHGDVAGNLRRRQIESSKTSSRRG